MKRSREPSTARWSIAGWCISPSRPDVAQPEAGRRRHVDLDRGEGPAPPQHVLEVELHLGRVEGGLALLDVALVARPLDGFLQDAPRPRPSPRARRGTPRDGSRPRSSDARRGRERRRPRSPSRRSGRARPRPGRARRRCGRRPGPWCAPGSGRSGCRERSFRCRRENSAQRTGQLAVGALLEWKRWQWPGQFMALMPSSSPSSEPAIQIHVVVELVVVARGLVEIVPEELRGDDLLVAVLRIERAAS